MDFRLWLVGLGTISGCNDGTVKINGDSDSFDSATVDSGDSAAETGDTVVTDDTGPTDTGAADDTADTGDTGDTGSAGDDPNLVASNDAMLKAFSSGTLNDLSGGIFADWAAATDSVLGSVQDGLTVTGTENEYGHYDVYRYGDSTTITRGTDTQEVAYMLLSTQSGLTVNPAEDLVRGAELAYDADALGVSSSYAFIAVNVTKDSDGEVVAASAVVTDYGTDASASGHVLLSLTYSGIEQKLTVFNNGATDKTTTFTDAAELDGAITGAQTLLGYLEQSYSNHVSIVGNEFH